MGVGNNKVSLSYKRRLSGDRGDLTKSTSSALFSSDNEKEEIREKATVIKCTCINRRRRDAAAARPRPYKPVASIIKRATLRRRARSERTSPARLRS